MITEGFLNLVDLKKRSDIHYARKIWHMSAVFAMFLAFVYLPEKVSLTLLVVAWILFVPFDFLRHRYPALNDIAVHAFKPIMRQSEVKKLAGTTFLLTGVLIVYVIFPRPIVALTLLFLAFADPIASYFGILYGKDKIFGHKSIQGFMAAFFVCMGLTLVFLLYHNYLTDRVIVISLLAGLVGAFAELIPVGKLDDNLTLPLMSAVGLSILFYFFGFFANVG
ncbi:diacylglycerol/polyprenol kinase family protein [Bdellovibrio sp. HCB288]|uniref:diacylglycerol/polyprenol kinase family protein n=2 Tax=unclassified Bdellovibrio TaxID=2633795 RepID=UPI0030F32098